MLFRLFIFIEIVLLCFMLVFLSSSMCSDGLCFFVLMVVIGLVVLLLIMMMLYLCIWVFIVGFL